MLIWDETKRRQNISKHGIDFAELLDVFERPNCTEVDDGQQTELRYRTHFFHHGRIAQLIWMERGRNVRFISCRFTGPREARRYCQELLQRGELEAAIAAAPTDLNYDYWDTPYDPNDEEEVALYWKNAQLSLPGEPLYRRYPGMPVKTVADKLFVQKAKTVAVINDGPANAALVAELPAEKLVKKGPADLVIYFANSQMELQKQLPKVKERLEPKAALWVAYVKGTSKLRSDLHRDTIREYGESIGLTSVAMISIDGDWSALRLKIT